MSGLMQRTPQGEEAARPSPLFLLVDDDVELCALLQEFFDAQGIRVDAVHDGRRGLSRALGGGYDLLLLDVMMPGLDGFALLRQIRRQSEVPVIMLTARAAKADRLGGLDAGADDYIPKPFDPDELLARARAVLRRAGRAAKPDDVLNAGVLRLIPADREARCEGVTIPLTTIEYDILEFLVRASGRIVSRDELTAALYQRRASPFDRAIDVHVSRLRKKLGPYGDRIVTVRGVGYLFRAGVLGEGDF